MIEIQTGSPHSSSRSLFKAPATVTTLTDKSTSPHEGARDENRIRRAVWESHGNQTPKTRRIGRYGPESQAGLTSQNAIHDNWVDNLLQIPKPCAKVRILPGAPMAGNVHAGR